MNVHALADTVRNGPITRIAAAFIAIIAVALLSAFVYDSLYRAPSFDGATNLQAAQSFADGEGYRRTYAGREPFPHSIQSNLPFVLPAAAGFKLLGMGIPQAQLSNIAYLLLLVAVVATLVGRRFGMLPAAMAIVMVCVTPGIREFGFGGYGEVPGLALALLALLVWPWREASHRGLRIFLAGILLGLAFATKVVLGICSVGFGLVFVVHLLVGARGAHLPRASLLERLAAITLLAAGSLLPILVVEMWKFIAVGGMSGYATWWQEGLGEIGKQAGTRAGFPDTPGLIPKVSRHLALLQGFLGMPMLALMAWLLLPFLLALPPMLRDRSWWRQGPLACLLLAAGLYFVWWLALTPTLKAYHRRILDGILLLNIAWIYVAGYYLLASGHSTTRRVLRSLPSLAILAFAVPLYRVDAGHSLFRPAQVAPDLVRAVGTVAGLPANASLFGTGWYSAPTVSLLANRPMRDFNDTPVLSIDRSRPAYFVFDTPGLAARRHVAIEEMYRARKLLPDLVNYQVYEVHLDELQDSVATPDLPRLQPTADLTSVVYPFVAGFHPPESGGRRWMSSDAFVILRYDGSPDVVLRVYTPPPDRYMGADGVRLTVLLDGCEVITDHKVAAGASEVSFPIPTACRPVDGAPATLRLMADDLVASGTIQDDRALSIIVGHAGFSGAD